MSAAPSAARRRIDVVAGVLQRPDGCFLLAQRPPGKVYAGYWEFPGGKIEDGETPLAALSRELHEELGIDVTTGHPWFVRDFDYEHAAVRLHFFRVRAWHGELQSREAQAFAWQRPEAPGVTPLLPANGPVLQALRLPEIYGITGFSPAQARLGLDAVRDALEQGLRLVQVRGKDWPAAAFRDFAAQIVVRARSCGARVLINADIGLARAIGADGVHLTARQLRDAAQRPDFPLVGASCHDAVELARAGQLDIDFVVLGPVLPTPTHPDAAVLGWDRFRQLAADTRIPVFALGGLQPADLALSLARGAQGLAMVRGAWPNFSAD